MRRSLARSVVALAAVVTVLGAAGSVLATDAAPEVPKAGPQGAAPMAGPQGAAPTASPTGAAPTASPQGAAPLASPFGPGWDPTRPPPEEPKESGPGIVSATVVAAGPAEVEQLRGVGKDGASPFFGVVLDVQIAAGSTTTLLGAASVVAQPESGSAVPLFVACTPTMDDPLAVYHGKGIGLSTWNIAVDGGAWFCGGRTGRLAIHVRDSGFRVTAKPGSAWKGPLVLLFEQQAESPRRVLLPGVTVELPLRARSDDRTN